MKWPITLFSLMAAVLILTYGCSIKQNQVLLSLSSNGPEASYPHPKFPLTSALYISESFKKFSLTESLKQHNRMYTFKVNAGIDLSKPLPAFFRNRFKKFILLEKNDPDWTEIDYLFIPDIYHSELHVRPSLKGESESYQYELKMKLNIFKGGAPYDIIYASGKIEGAVVELLQSSGNYKRIAIEKYDMLVTKLFSNIDTYLFNIMNPDCM